MAPLTPPEIDAIRLSLLVALVGTAASLLPGVALGWLLARRTFPGRQILNALVHLPLVLPPVVVGYFLLLGFGRRGPLGAWLDHWFGFSFAFNWKGAALAASVMGFPLLVRSIWQSLDAVDRRIEDAARTLGAAPWMVFATISLPLIAPGILAGALLAFARSLGEFGATITFVSAIPGETVTIPVAIWGLTQTPGGDPAALRLSLIAVLLSFGTLALADWVNRRLVKKIHGQ